MDYKKLFDLSEKVCVIIGGSGYLGSECVRILKDFGATVVNADIKEREGGAEDLFLSCNIKEKDAYQKLFQEIVKNYGRLDVVVNSALYGSQKPNSAYIEYMNDETFERGVEGTLASVFRSIRDSVPFLKEKGGSIINFCSMYGIVSPDFRIYGDNPQRNSPWYGSAKAGVMQLTRYAASDLAKYNIRVNAVTPGPFPCPANQTDEAFNTQLAGKTMLGRFGVNHEIAGAILLLASDASSFMTGSNITVDGGWTAW